ncbi:hypothetical protein TFLX_01936 [Thermoflexales bacterium]|nr:hypothetical protein TFLX_01936 [Thermoflexales bacterium]
MKHEARWLICGTLIAISIFCGLLLLVAAQPVIAVESTGKSLSLAEAPLVVKVLMGLAALVSGGLLLAPFFRTELKTLHKEKSC